MSGGVLIEKDLGDKSGKFSEIPRCVVKVNESKDNIWLIRSTSNLFSTFFD